ncbi:nucleosome assembly protein 1;3-like [Cynara cardunculus var. scolymus]|uniref:nucleosome assembly protein 1;3-like n=1 Tax=Cynara cardunculus var. scolymus TaxID=59895 RepID=UPI000D62D235|nr:nucleosome assembly protein 1;3-like [Cynara cardunculus var. scolymus]
MSAKNVNFAIDEVSFKPNNHVALLDIPANKPQFEDVGRFLRNSPIFFAIFHEHVIVKEVLQQFWFTAEVKQETDKTGIVLTDDETITIGLEVAPLEISQSTEAYPLEGKQGRTSINPSDGADDPSEPPAMEEEYNMDEDVKLILPAEETVLIKMDQVHEYMPLRDDLSFDLSAVKFEVNDVKKLLSMVQADVCTKAEAISALKSKADKTHAQLTKHGEMMHQILDLLQRLEPVPASSFTVEDRLLLDQVLELGLLQAQSLAKIKQQLDIDAKTNADAQDERVKANKVAAEVVDAITSHEAEAVAEVEEINDVVRADAQDEDLPITSAVDVGDKEDEDDDDDEDDDPSSFPDAGKDLGDDDDEDDDDNFTI